MTKLITALRLNMTNAADPAGDHADRYRAALDMATYADEQGFTAVSCEEHHLAPTGWLPSPLVLAAAVAGRTRTVRISINALLITLYDPVKLAEDIAVLDNISEGRFSFVAGMGYRPEEYGALDKSWHERGRLMDECLAVMLKAWADEPFEHRGRLINVTPKPRTKPHPVMFVGGMSTAAATRAARFGLPFSPPTAIPGLEAQYLQELAAHGKDGFVYRPENGNTVTVLSEDPERTWTSCGHHFLTEATEYSGWRHEGVSRPNEEDAGSVTELRKLNKVEVLTPDQLISQCEAGRREVVAHPLIGGLPLDEGWTSLRLLGDRVLPELRARGLA